MSLTLSILIRMGLPLLLVITGFLISLRRIKGITYMTQKCRAALSPACTCLGGCPPPAFCACLPCSTAEARLGFGAPWNPNLGSPVSGSGGSSSSVHFSGSFVATGGSSSSGSSGPVSGGGSGGSGGLQWGSGGGGSGGIVAVNKQPSGTGSGMTGFGEKGQRELDFAFGTVSGLRQWTLDGPDFSLDPSRAEADWTHAPVYGATGFGWSAGTLEGWCNNGKPHAVPCETDPVDGSRCGCGFWAYWDMAGLSGNRFSPSGIRRLPVLGVIEGFGRVIIGERGFRSQKARISALSPAFTIQAEVSPAWAENQGEAQQEMQRRAQAHADAWMAVIQDRLQTMYPEARVFATTAGLLASVKTEGKPD